MRPGLAAAARGAAVAVAAALSMAGCGGGAGGDATPAAPAKPDKRRPPAAGTGSIVAALAPLPGGGLRVGELTTGVVRDLGGPVRTRVAVSIGGQRGLLGLVVDGRGRTFAAYTARGAREPIVVDQVLPAPHRRVWTGPPSTDLADGGHLALLGDGRLAIGIGDLQDPARTPADGTANGKLLSLDPDGSATQKPRVLSRGWNNPFAFARVGRTPELVVADNAPGARPERLARGDRGGRAPGAVTNLPDRAAPSGLAVLGPHEVVVCGVRSGRLTRYRRARVGGRWRAAGTLGACAFGVARLTDGRLAVATAAGVRVLRP